MGFLTSTPVLLVGLWLAAALVLRVLYAVLRREREAWTEQARLGRERLATTYGTLEVRTAVALGAVVTVVLALGLTWDLVGPRLDEDELDDLVSDVATSYSEDRGSEDVPELTDEAVLDRFEDAGGDREDVVVQQMAPGWEPVDQLGRSPSGVRFQVTADDGPARCLEVTYRPEDGSFFVLGQVVGDLC